MEQPIMQRALGADWSRLGAVVRNHYDITPGTTQRRVMRGHMDVRHAPWARPLLWAGRLFGALVHRQGSDIPVQVENWTEPGSPAMHWHRSFRFTGRAPHLFRSRMEYLGGDEIVEYVRWGLGIRMRLRQQEGALVYEGLDYQWDVGALRLRLPDWLLLGKARIREWPLGEARFAMEFRVRHPWLGEVFSYAGEFELLE